MVKIIHFHFSCDKPFKIGKLFYGTLCIRKAFIRKTGNSLTFDRVWGYSIRFSKVWKFPDTFWRINFGQTKWPDILFGRFSKLRDIRVKIRRLHAWMKLVIIKTLFSQFRNQLLINSLKIFDFWKMSRFYSKNVRELGSQVPDFLHVWPGN